MQEQLPPARHHAQRLRDVEARFGLAPELTGRLKGENILYDRDELGEFFQLYSPTYAGYGAANAIFRISAL